MNIVWSRRRYSEEEFVVACSSARSIAECAVILGLVPAGGTYKTIKNTAKHLGIDISHMGGQAWSRGLRTYDNSKRPLDEVLVEDSVYSSYSLKRRLLYEGLLEPKCYAPYCPVPNPSVNPFTGEPIPLKLALDHINGNNRDNRLENLRLLCYHCHGETDTYCGKNVGKK